MALSLRIPRVEVFWGSVNLSCYTEGGPKDPLYQQPLVYNVSVSLTESGQTPAASMNWNPSGAAYKVYERLVRRFTDQVITIRFYYLDGRSITFAFVWSGQQENYGESMELKVSLSSELDGLVNSLLKNTAQADPEEKGFSLTKSVKDQEKSYGVDRYNLVGYTAKAKEDMEKTKMLEGYSQGSKFYETIAAIAENNGNLVFASNIVTSGSGPAIKCVIFTPYTWDKNTPVEELGPTQQAPDPAKRYGYFLGPGLINTITKQSQWQPSQKRQALTLNTQQKLQSPDNLQQGTITRDAVPQKQGERAERAARPTPGATGTSSSNSQAKMRLTENEDGAEKGIILEEERQCKLSCTLFMCPTFTGIKPYDIIFIPNFSGTFMEDWIVNSVEYSQTDGGVNINIQASRKFALGGFMNPTQGNAWLSKAKSYGLVGEGAQLENWMNYGWKRTSSIGGSSPSPSPSGPIPLPVIPFEVSGFTLGESSSIG
jgi:hypothetical protein